MPYDQGARNPDGSYSFRDSTGALPDVVTANTPAAVSKFNELESRRQTSAPLAAAGPVGTPDVMAIVREQAAHPPRQVSDVRPSLEQVHADPLGAIATSQTPLRLDSGVPVPGAATGPRAAPPGPARAPQAAPAGPGQIVFAGGGGGTAGAPQEAGAPNYAAASADLYARAAMRPGGPAQLVRGGKAQTGETVKVTDNRAAPEAEQALSDATTTRMLADDAQQRAAAAHEADVEGHMGFARYIEQGKDQLFAERRQEALDGYRQQIDDLDKKIGETKIDPGHFWADKTTGQKIAFVLASAITGAFNGYAGRKENQVLDAINKHVDEDIAAQVRNLETQKGRVGELGRIYQQAKDQWRDKEIARGIAKDAALADARRKAIALSQESGSKLAVANAAKMVATIDEARAKLHFDQEQRVSKQVDQSFKVTQDHYVGGGPSDAQRAALMAKAGEQQAAGAKYAQGPEPGKGPQTAVFGDETYNLGNLAPAEAQKVRERLAVVDVINRDLGELEKLRDGSVAEKLVPSGYQKDVVGRISENLSTLKGMGVVRESDIDRTLGALTSVRSGSDSIRSTRAFLQATGAGILRQSGSRPTGVAK